jgi:hypothetical protein
MQGFIAEMTLVLPAIAARCLRMRSWAALHLRASLTAIGVASYHVREVSTSSRKCVREAIYITL